jgi:hypothetical protein
MPLMSFPDKIEQIINPAPLPVEGFDDGQVPYGSDDGGVHISERDCLVSAVRVGLSCSRGVPFQRLSMKDAATELRSSLTLVSVRLGKGYNGEGFTCVLL